MNRPVARLWLCTCHINHRRNASITQPAVLAVICVFFANLDQHDTAQVKLALCQLAVSADKQVNLQGAVAAVKV